LSLKTAQLQQQQQRQQVRLGGGTGDIDAALCAVQPSLHGAERGVNVAGASSQSHLLALLLLLQLSSLQ